MIFMKGWVGDMPPTYPLRLELCDQDCAMVNPCDGVSHGVGEPALPGCEEWKEQQDALVALSNDVSAGRWPGWYLEYCGVSPTLSPILVAAGLSESDPKGCAMSVRMDQPLEIFKAVMDWISKEKIPLKKRPAHVGEPFIERNFDPAEYATSMMSKAIRKTFEVKYYYGVPRPEEWFGTLKVTQYPEGCPAHASYPSGHGSVGGSAYRATTDKFDLTEEQRMVLYTATRQFAHFRDFAGMHTLQDSLVGWMIGAGEI